MKRGAAMRTPGVNLENLPKVPRLISCGMSFLPCPLNFFIPTKSLPMEIPTNPHRSSLPSGPTTN
jgi:hypothetical protein